MHDDEGKPSSLQDCHVLINASEPAEAITWIYTDTDKLIIQVIIPAVSAVGLLANLAFLIVIARVPKMRTVVSVYLANLALCDMLFLAFSNVWYGLSLQKTDVTLGWPVNTGFGCAMLTLTSYSWYYASVGLQTLISVERYIAICHPIRHLSFKGGKRNAKLLAMIWISAPLVTLTIAPRYCWYFYICIIWPDTPEYSSSPSVVGFLWILERIFQPIRRFVDDNSLRHFSIRE